MMPSAASEGASTVPIHGTGPGASPRAALQALRVEPVPHRLAKTLLVRNHYLHSMPGGTCLAFGVFLGSRLLGALTFGVGPTNGYRLVERAGRDDCLTLTRFWLDEYLPRNSESRVLGVIARALGAHTSLKFLLSYADPAQGHRGVIYAAAGWLFTGRSQQTPLYRVGDSEPRHSRTFSSIFGTRSADYFREHHLEVKMVRPMAKHRYILFLDHGWRPRLRVPVLPYPKPIQEAPREPA